MKLYYADTESIGLTGPIVLMQYAIDGGPVQLHHVFDHSVPRTMELIEEWADNCPVFFNSTHDWFHINKLYNLLLVLKSGGYTGIPTVDTLVEIDKHAPSSVCVRPRSTHDVMLYARRTKYQMTLERRPFIVKRVPTQLAFLLADELEQSVDLPDILFYRRSSKKRWHVEPSRAKGYTENNKVFEKDLSDVRLSLEPSSGLDAIAQAELGTRKEHWPIPSSMLPTEAMWKPYGQYGERPWGVVAHANISFWKTSDKAQHYAKRDVEILRDLHRSFGHPEPGDTDSVLACDLGATRWRGFAIDHDKLQSIADEYEKLSRTTAKAPKAVFKLLEPMLPEIERLAFHNTRKETLETIVEHTTSDEAREFAGRVLKARQADKRRELAEKLLQLDAFRPEFKVIGTKSNRQAGGSESEGINPRTGSINPQGIPRGSEFREAFPMAYPGEVLIGGDADSYEITILDAVCGCPYLHDQLKQGKKFHALMGKVWLNLDYDDMMQNEDAYAKVKAGDFAFVYGAQVNKMASVLGLETDEAEDSMRRLKHLMPEVYDKREEVAMRFCSMRQPGGLGTKVIWHEPDDYVESMFGFRRYFTIQNAICKRLFEIGNNPPKSFRGLEGKVLRMAHKGPQTLLGALQSACYACAFNIQAANMRAACNHEIQSPGGEVTKEAQRAQFDLQPCGVHAWRIRVFNLHDELLAVCDSDATAQKSSEVMEGIINKYRSYIPLLKWGWSRKNSWGDK